MIGANMFQFHKVRLKVNSEFVTCDEAAEFQFHKVRLKERGWFESCSNVLVSIPQGTIKSIMPTDTT